MPKSPTKMIYRAATIFFAAALGGTIAPHAAAQTSFPGSTGSVANSEVAESLPAGPFPTNFSTMDAFSNATLNPDTPPPGADDPKCIPSPEHPRPVVLVHGTLENRTFNWWSLSPVLRNAGYCVFTFNYGQEIDAWRLGAPGAFKVGGTGPMMESASELSEFVDEVRRDTGSNQVDLVGHSQGGTMPRLYLQYMGGAPKLANLVGMAPDNAGTDFLGLMNIPPVQNALTALLGPAIAEQATDSEIIRKLNADGGIPAGPRYTVIASRYDWIVTPWTSGLLQVDDQLLPEAPYVENVVLQESCANNYAEHLSIVFNPAAIAEVLHALDPSYQPTVPCAISAPIVGG